MSVSVEMLHLEYSKMNNYGNWDNDADQACVIYKYTYAIIKLGYE